MSEEIRLLIEHAGVRRNLIWISLQDDGAISVGFLDRPFVFEGFTSELELDAGMRESAPADLRATHRLEAITDPHFTFHPP
jgi:hypothetical protein